MPSQSQRRLTAIVLAYNDQETVADTARPFLAQTRPPAEVVVIDDCSTDATGEVRV